MTSSRHHRFALLICDTPIPPVVEQYGDYLKIFTTYLQASIPAHLREDVSFEMDGYDVVDACAYPREQGLDKEGGYDGVILTGSAFSAYEDKPWIDKLVEYVAWLGKEKPHVKIVGICFGHQIIARSFEMSCVPNNGIWEVGITIIPLNDLGKEVFGVDTLHIEQMHRDHVPLSSSGTLASSFQLLGSTNVCPNQGMVLYHPDSTSRKPEDIHILTLQGHPEFLPSIVSPIVSARTASGAMSKDVADDWRTREEDRLSRGIGNEGVSVVGKTIWRMFGVH